MKKLFQKDEVWFAVGWIIVYVLVFANADSLSDAMGIPKLLTVVFGAVLTGILLGFIRKNKLDSYFGLCPIRDNCRQYLYFLPLVLVSSVNLWNGITTSAPLRETVFFILSMCFVGILEEVIFRGLLFRGMSKTNVTSAIVVSSLTFGMGHIVNLLLGEPVLDTLLQLIYASAIGFCYTAVFYTSGSILPCILSHAVVNSTSIFAAPPTVTMQLAITVIQTLISTAYGLWLLRHVRAPVSAQ